ncbi:uncharacterized protein LOC116001366 [Ipomoea triloba]|uniref:uncharacterized protein LOC116001366 n=1 Tax=Ipomoea triloba TaxID=35885 RepID=UPI00125D026B|nr:uncharacterized protein LOC116001366 [Ipomoea triloba]
MQVLLQIIDNRPVPEGIKAVDKYEGCPEKLLIAFTKYLATKKIALAKKMKQMRVQYVQMPWQNEENAVDCAIYSMRHMQTYTGTSIEDWNAGLTGGPEDNTFLTSLRAKYAATILMSEWNTLLSEVTNAAKELYKQSK